MAYARYVYSELAQLIAAYHSCNSVFAEETHRDYAMRHWERIHEIVTEYLPSGSGFDTGTTLLTSPTSSHADKLTFSVAFHHMNEVGYYDGWTEHKVIVTPSFIGGFRLRVTGRNRNDIKDYIAEAFHTALMSEMEE